MEEARIPTTCSRVTPLWVFSVGYGTGEGRANFRQLLFMLTAYMSDNACRRGGALVIM